MSCLTKYGEDNAHEHAHDRGKFLAPVGFTKKKLTWIEELRAGAAICELVPGISQWALLHRKTSATDAARELVPKPGERYDPIIEIRMPARRQSPPVLISRRPAFGQRVERLFHRGEWNAESLGHLNDRYTPQHFAWVPALIARVAPTADESFRLVEMDRGHGDPAAVGDFADAQFAMNFSRHVFFHRIP